MRKKLNAVTQIMKSVSQQRSIIYFSEVTIVNSRSILFKFQVQYSERSPNLARLTAPHEPYS